MGNLLPHVASAFDRVPRPQLIGALGNFGIDPHAQRLINNRQQGRSFMVKYNTPIGLYGGKSTLISTGLPQGGVRSPELWLTYFNQIHPQLVQLRQQALYLV